MPVRGKAAVVWEAVYEDLSIFSSQTHSASDLPLDGLQAVVVDNRVYTGLDCCGWDEVDGNEVVLVPRPTTSYEQMCAEYPNAVVARSKTTSCRQMHQVEKLVGVWAEEVLDPADATGPGYNVIPYKGWMKDVIGFRVSTETEVSDSTGLEEAGWFDFWAQLPDTGWQGLMLHENWKTAAGDDIRQGFSGGDHYAIAPSPYGPVFLNTNDPREEIEQRYPGAIVKIGTQLPDREFWALHEKLMSMTQL